jgi:predicted nucleic acid-binding protein
LGLIVLDTSVLIDQLRGHVHARAALRAVQDAGETLAASLVTKVELLAGMRSHERKVTRDLMAAITWIGIDDNIAERAGTMARRHRASHHGIGVVDYLIAATVEQVDGELWTRNIKHFPMFPKLLPPY